MFQANDRSSLEQLEIALESTEVSGVIDTILTNLKAVNRFLKKINPYDTNQVSGMCLEVSRYFNNILKKKGIHAVILQGEIEEEPLSWNEHHASLIYLKNHWMTVDFTASQFGCYHDAPFVILITEPNKNSLKKALIDAYDWWFPSSKEEE